MNHDMIALAVLALGATGLCVLLLAVPRLFAPRTEGDRLLDTFECGVPIRDAGQRRMQVKFYLVAIVFIIFDVEAVFLFPWAVRFRSLGLFGLIEMLFFLAVLSLGLLHVWRKGGLEWE